MIVAFSGMPHSGKDTCGGALIETFGFVRCAIADIIRDVLAAMFDWSPYKMANSDFKDGIALVGEGRSYTGREVQQRLGVAIRRVLGEDLLINLVLDKCPPGRCTSCNGEKSAHLPRSRRCTLNGSGGVYLGSRHYVFTDIRWPNEVHVIQSVGGKVIRLNRNDRTGVHDFAGSSARQPCTFAYGETVCGLPQESHPIHFNPDRHAAENSLPDGNNAWIRYDAVLSGNATANLRKATELVRDWLSMPDAARAFHEERWERPEHSETD